MFRILVAEDDDSARFLMCEVLRRAGYDPCPARDGLEALEVMEHYQCDLAVVDITMPRMDGITFTQTLREGNCDLPVLMVTARVTQEDKRRGFRAGTDDYMVKPVDEEEMLWRIEALLRRHGFHFSKSMGQNFLIDASIPAAIAEASEAGEGNGVLEIGPGIGALSHELCRRAGKVVAVEVDTSLQPLLAETMAGCDNLEILFRDILKTDIPALVREEFPGLRPMACANLPYYITTPVLAALLESRSFEAVTVMVQKEVAQRICSAPGRGEYGAFSVFCQYYAEPELLFDVPASCFIPQPKVTSSVIRLTRRAAPPYAVRDEKLLMRIVRAAFNQRRKTLVNALSSQLGVLDKENAARILVNCGFDTKIRGETVDIVGFAKISDEISSIIGADL